MDMKEEFKQFVKAESDIQQVSPDEYAIAYLAFKAAWDTRVPEDYAIVPREPTDEMVSSYYKTVDGYGSSVPIGYKAMVEAGELK
jgi:hypothetical protein